MRLTEAQQKIAVRGGGVNLVAELLQRGLGGIEPGRRGKRNQRGLVRGRDEIEGAVHLSFRMGGELGESALPAPGAAPGFMRSEPAELFISPRAFVELSMPRETTLRLVL